MMPRESEASLFTIKLPHVCIGCFPKYYYLLILRIKAEYIIVGIHTIASKCRAYNYYTIWQGSACLSYNFILACGKYEEAERANYNTDADSNVEKLSCFVHKIGFLIEVNI